jgi:phospholipase A1/A2
MEETAAGAESPPFGAPGEETVCAGLAPDVERLKCYDDAAQRKGQPQEESNAAPRSPTSHASLMGVRWELDPGTENGLFSIRPHKQVYVLPVRYTTDVNNQPSSPT